MGSDPKEVRFGVRLGTEPNGLRNRTWTSRGRDGRFALSGRVRKTVGFGEPLPLGEAAGGARRLTEDRKSPMGRADTRPRDGSSCVAPRRAPVLIGRAKESFTVCVVWLIRTSHASFSLSNSPRSLSTHRVWLTLLAVRQPPCVPSPRRSRTRSLVIRAECPENGVIHRSEDRHPVGPRRLSR